MSRKRLLIASAVLASAACASAALAQNASTRTPQEPTPRAFSTLFGGDNFLGVYTENVTRENAGRYGLSGEPRGVGVTEVVENSPAARAGLQKGDVILSFDGERVTSTQKLLRLINESAPEHTARLTVARGGSEREVSATLGRHDALGGARSALRVENGEAFRWDGKDWQKIPDEEWRKQSEEMRKQSEEWRKQADQMRGQLQRMKPMELSPDAERRLRDEMGRMQGNFDKMQGGFAFAFGAGRRIGVTTTPLTDQLADYFGVGHDGGVLVTSVVENGPAAKAGLRAGDIITEVDGERIKGTGDLTRLLSRRDDGDVTLAVTRDRGRRTFKVTPEKSPAPTTWTTPDGLFTAPGAALALPRGGFVVRPSGVLRPSAVVGPSTVVRPSAITAPRTFTLPTLPRLIVPARPLRPMRGVVTTRGQLMEL